ncbi:hypothetical protein JTB14_037718 [Gonioctena quinquepunctata]|nr:hypothetical protein JTB14_037718 [Gonioctena quinquepunctata]
MLTYIFAGLVMISVNCEPFAQNQGELPSVLVTPNQLASGALLRLQQNQFSQAGVRENQKLLLLPINNQVPLGTFSRLQQNPTSQPGVYPYNPNQNRHLASREDGGTELPTFPREIVQKSPNSPNDRDMEGKSEAEGGLQVAERQRTIILSNSVVPGTFLRLQQNPFVQPGVILSSSAQPRSHWSGDEGKDVVTKTPKHDDEESEDVSNGNQRKTGELQPSLEKRPNQPTLGKLIRLQQDPTLQPGVFFYNPTRPRVPGGEEIDADEENDEIETTTRKGVNSQPAAENDGEKDLHNAKLADSNAEKGNYYIYHPTGLLQEVTYSTKDDPANMAFMTSLKYKNVNPIREPIYTYDPQTFVFRKV